MARFYTNPVLQALSSLIGKSLSTYSQHVRSGIDNSAFNAVSAASTKIASSDQAAATDALEPLPLVDPQTTTAADESPLTALDSKETATRHKAAKKIQHTWWGSRIKKKFIEKPYPSYLSLVDKDDKKHLLSSIMFGQNVATRIKKDSPHYVNNPYIETGVRYHREDELSGQLKDTLIKQFALIEDPSCDYIPIINLRNTPVETVLRDYCSDASYHIVKKEGLSIDLLVIKKNQATKLRTPKIILRSLGLIASRWEIAENITTAYHDAVEKEDILARYKLPSTKKELIESDSYKKLNAITRKEYPTKQLSECLLALLHDIPEGLNPSAVKRITLMLDLADTFYLNHYPRYAFCVYAIIHEISLCLSKKTEPMMPDPANPIQSEQDASIATFAGFMKESRRTLLEALGVDKELQNTQFVASPAISGSNAYALAIDLANKIKTPDAHTPKIMIYEPSYYEFESVSTSTTKDPNEADIFILSAGPILMDKPDTPLYPGMDINRFIRKNILKIAPPKHVTVIVDTTTALYKNLKLDSDVQALIDAGLLSLLFHESHQKFGLIHSDQAQYGRLFGLCSKTSFDPNVLATFQNNAEKDFDEHIDLRIGAFISEKCAHVLEKIKEQHFRNGAILRNILAEAKIAQAEVATFDEMLQTPNELYFIDFKDLSSNAKISRMIEKRDSFGHFHTVLSSYGVSHRISPDASDQTDCLIQSAQLYLINSLDLRASLDVLMNGTRPEVKILSIEEKIIALALMNNIVAQMTDSAQLPPDIDNKKLAGSLSDLMKKCSSLSGRQYYQTIFTYLSALKVKIKILDYITLLQSHDDLQPKSLAFLQNITKKMIDRYGLEKIIQLITEETKQSALRSHFIFTSLYFSADDSIKTALLRHFLQNQIPSVLVNFFLHPKATHEEKEDILASIPLSLIFSREYRDKICPHITTEQKNRILEKTVSSDGFYETIFSSLSGMVLFYKEPQLSLVLSKILEGDAIQLIPLYQQYNEEIKNDFISLLMSVSAGLRIHVITKLVHDLPNSQHIVSKIIDNPDLSSCVADLLLKPSKINKTITSFSSSLGKLYVAAGSEEKETLLDILQRENTLSSMSCLCHMMSTHSIAVVKIPEIISQLMDHPNVALLDQASLHALYTIASPEEKNQFIDNLKRWEAYDTLRKIEAYTYTEPDLRKKVIDFLSVPQEPQLSLDDLVDDDDVLDSDSTASP